MQRALPPQHLRNVLVCILEQLSGLLAGNPQRVAQSVATRIYAPLPTFARSSAPPARCSRSARRRTEPALTRTPRVTDAQTRCVSGRNLFGIVEALWIDLSLLVQQEHALGLTIAVSCSRRKVWPMAFKPKPAPGLRQQHAASAGSATRVPFVIKNTADLPRWMAEVILSPTVPIMTCTRVRFL